MSVPLRNIALSAVIVFQIVLIAWLLGGRTDDGGTSNDEVVTSEGRRSLIAFDSLRDGLPPMGMDAPAELDVFSDRTSRTNRNPSAKSTHVRHKSKPIKPTGPKPTEKVYENRVPNDDQPHFSLVPFEKVAMLRPQSQSAHDSIRKVYVVSNPDVGLTIAAHIIVPPANAKERSPRVTFELTEDDTDRKVMHFDWRLWMHKVVFNTKNNDWFHEEENRTPSFGVGSKVVMKIVVQPTTYEVYLNDERVAACNKRTGSDEEKRIKHLLFMTNIEVQAMEMPPEVVAEQDQALQGGESEYVNHNLLIPNHEYQVFIGVMTTTSNFVHRWAQRKAWLNYPEVKQKKVLVRFFIAMTDNANDMKRAREENQRYQDMVFLTHKDSYRSIGYKTLAMALFASKIRVKYMFKCDDDTYVRIPRLLAKLEGKDGQTLYMGSISYGNGPIRDPGSKWVMSFAEYPGNSYPPFAHGPGYILSRDLFTHIANEQAKGEANVLPLEDITMAVWVDHAKTAHRMNVNYVNDHSFDIGSCRNDMTSGHYIEPDRQIRIFERDIRGEHVIC